MRLSAKKAAQARMTVTLTSPLNGAMTKAAPVENGSHRILPRNRVRLFLADIATIATMESTAAHTIPPEIVPYDGHDEERAGVCVPDPTADPHGKNLLSNRTPDTVANQCLAHAPASRITRGAERTLGLMPSRGSRG